MADPTRSGIHMYGGDPAVEHAEQDRLLTRIEDERMLSGWCWTPLTDTLAALRELPDELAWAATRYLQAVIVQRDAMFSTPEHLQLSMEADKIRPALPCPCGTDAPADRPRTRHRREVVTASCPSCGALVAQFDGEPYDGRTLIAAGFAH